MADEVIVDPEFGPVEVKREEVERPVLVDDAQVVHVEKARDAEPPRTHTVLLDGGPHIKVHPLVHEAEGGHYGWQMSSVDHAALMAAIHERRPLHDMHTREEVGFDVRDDGLSFRGMPVSVHV